MSPKRSIIQRAEHTSVHVDVQLVVASNLSGYAALALGPEEVRGGRGCGFLSLQQIVKANAVASPGPSF
jgi:hypothetical protein